MDKLNDVLLRLTNVKEKDSGQYMADCPCTHHTKTNNQHLAIKENEAGVIGIHCFAGCFTDEVLSEICMTMKDLFPAKTPIEREQWRENQVVHAVARNKDSNATKLWVSLSILKESIQSRIFNDEPHPENKTELWDKEKQAVSMLPEQFKSYYGRKK